jgi:hypothetical protein
LSRRDGTHGSVEGTLLPSGKAAHQFLIESERRMKDPNALTERQARALELRRVGWKWTQIARELGMERGNAQQMVEIALLKEKRRERLEARRAHERTEAA